MRGHQIEALCFSEVIKGTLDLDFDLVGTRGFGSPDLRKWGPWSRGELSASLCVVEDILMSQVTGSFSLGQITEGRPLLTAQLSAPPHL